jgi:hypothetical protein
VAPPSGRATVGQQAKGKIPLDSISLESAVVAEAAGWASPAELADLECDHGSWATALRRLLYQTDEALAQAHRATGEERDQVLADLNQERRQLAASLAKLTGESAGGTNGTVRRAAPEADAAPEEPGVALLQGSWADGRLVVWAAGSQAEALGGDELEALVRQADGGSISWERHGSVPVPGGHPAEARSAPIAHTLGWLVGIGAGQIGGELIAPSLRWLGEVAVWGTQLVAEGKMVPVLRTSTSSGTQARGQGKHRVRWVPALSGRDRLQDLAAALPGAVSALQTAPQADGLCRSVLSAVVDAVCRAGADRLVAPAAVPQATSRVEISEAILSGLDGRPFTADVDNAARLAEELKRWASPVTAVSRVGLTVRLDPPGADGGWLLRVEATGVDKGPLPVEHALVVASGSKSQQVEAQLRRLERLLPVLRRPSTRRGQVILDGDEAADVMFTSGPGIAAAGFEVLLPLVSRQRPRPQLRMFAEAFGGPSQVGVAQLSNVRWSVLFDDLELDAADIARLAAEAQPLIQVKGRWVHVDRADLAAAAAALAERASITQLSGAALIRHAVGLEGSPLGGPVQVVGSGWAVDLLQGATSHPPSPIEAPKGFRGQLRHYQAEAAGWLAFLDRAGLGGCLAMDMGLGKTPTVLAHLLATRDQGPALVICPPAVLTNWAAEAARFTPTLRVRIHHGPRRAEADQLPVLASVADVVLTTYATAVRDIEPLSKIDWRRTIVDEAQAIKNHQSDTARALRRLPQRSRLAMTGTPVENGLGDLWSILDFANPGLVGPRTGFVEHLSHTEERGDAGRPEEAALRALNGLLVFRRTKMEPEIAAELPDKVDKLDHCAMTAEQVGLYQAVGDPGGLFRGRLRRCGRPRPGAGCQRPEGPGSGRHHRPQADLRPPRCLPRRGRGHRAHRALRQIGPPGGDRGRRLRLGGEGADLHPLRPLGRTAGHLPDGPHVDTGAVLPRRLDPTGARRDGQDLPGATGSGRPGAVHQGGRVGAESHCGQPRGPLRPLVEPGGGGPGPRPGMAHRADLDGGVPSAGLPGDGGRAGGGDRVGQAAGGRPGPPGPQLAGRPRRRADPHRAGAQGRRADR